jgi:hypothetical protein
VQQTTATYPDCNPFAIPCHLIYSFRDHTVPVFTNRDPNENENTPESSAFNHNRHRNGRRSAYPVAAMAWSVTPDYEHVLLISVDGMHAIDLANWVQYHPTSNFAKLANSGVIYPNAFTTAPSDSYPGMIAQVTGASPKTAGLFYDDSYDRTEYPSEASYTSQSLPDPGCTGGPGTEVTNFEELDVGYNFTTALVTDITGGGTLGQVYTQLDPYNMSAN